LHTKVIDGNKFRLSIVEKEKYGSERFIEFSENGASFTITCEKRIVCEFQSNSGPVGTSGGIFRIASKEFRNFNLSVVSLVIIMQIDALKEGPKGVLGLYIKDIGQMPSRSFLMKSSKGRDSIEKLSIPPSDAAPPFPSDPIGNRKVVQHSSPLLLEKATTSPVSPRKENPRKSRSGALSPEDPKRKLSTEKDTPPEKEFSKKKGKNNKVAKNTEKPPPQSPRYLISEGLEKSPITVPGGDSYVKCWDVLEAIVAQSNGNQT